MKWLEALSPSLLAAVSIQVLCQIFKVVFYSFKNHRLEMRRLIHPGGMPSAHSAFVTTLTASIGLRSGFSSELFALAFVFSIIIIYDSIRLRGAVQVHSRLLARLCKLLPEDERLPVSQFIGHTGPELTAGVLVGVVWAVLLGLLL